MLAIGLFCSVLYHLFNGRRQYQDGDLSVVYPLCQTSMIYVPTGVALLGERFTVDGVGGILLVILGTFSVQMKRMSFAELARPFRDMSSPGPGCTQRHFIYSIGSIAQNTGVRHYSPSFILPCPFHAAAHDRELSRPKYRMLIIEEFRDTLANPLFAVARSWSSRFSPSVTV